MKQSERGTIKAYENKNMKQSEYLSLLENCMLCPRRCGVNRLIGEIGICGAGAELRVARAELHEWEEPPICMGKGSGAVFFSHCTLRCCYCQNREISSEGKGKLISVIRLAEIFLELEKKGACNINLVTPTHYVPHIISAIDEAKSLGLQLPAVYNTSGYERKEIICMLDGYMDTYLTDFKYWSDQSAKRYSAAKNYVQNAKEALSEMVKQRGSIRYGVIVRHLLLPGKLDEAKSIVSYIHQTYGNSVTLSLMSQYTPCRQSPDFPELNTAVDEDDYERLLDYADAIGVKDFFWQEGDAAKESFIPPFDNTGV